MELVQRLIQNKKFQRYLIEKRYPIAIDGTQKLTRDGQWWGEEWLQREYKTEDGPYIQQYVYVLEANLVFHNGLTVPLLSEFLRYGEGDPDDHKQDGELKAFKRLAARLKGYFKRLPLLLLLDGLYPNGPLMEQCRLYHWDYRNCISTKVSAQCLDGGREPTTVVRTKSVDPSMARSATTILLG